MDRYSMACTEILEILKYLPNEDYKKIPEEEIDFFEQNKETGYNFKFNENVSFEEQVILPETQAIIVKLYRDYFCSDEDKLTIDRYIHINKEMNTNGTEAVDSISDIKFQKKELKSTNYSQENALKIPKTTWYDKIFNIFKNIIH